MIYPNTRLQFAIIILHHPQVTCPIVGGTKTASTNFLPHPISGRGKGMTPTCQAFGILVVRKPRIAVCSRGHQPQMAALEFREPSDSVLHGPAEYKRSERPRT